MKSIFFTLIIALTVFFNGCNNPSLLKNITVTEPDLSAVTNGTYRGSYSIPLQFGELVGNSSATIDVTVSNNKYFSIIPLDSKLVGYDVVTEFIGRIISNQRVDIDGITGGSYTTIAIKKAIENAFIK